jgi:predicted KAP-like P-loop ATPase
MITYTNLGDDTPDKESIYSDGLKKIEKTMNQIINEHPSARIVVFIDDLDRCAPPTTLEVFESIKIFLDIQGFVCVIGLDYKTISKLIGEQYISKIIQLPIVMPERKSLDIQELKTNRRSILIINK